MVTAIKTSHRLISTAFKSFRTHRSTNFKPTFRLSPLISSHIPTRTIHSMSADEVKDTVPPSATGQAAPASAAPVDAAVSADTDSPAEKSKKSGEHGPSSQIRHTLKQQPRRRLSALRSSPKLP